MRVAINSRIAYFCQAQQASAGPAAAPAKSGPNLQGGGDIKGGGGGCC